MIKKIPWNKIIDDPINNFYNNLTQDFSEAIEEFLKRELSDIGSDFKRQEKLGDKIKSNNEEIERFKKEHKITLRSFQKWSIIAGFFVLIGFFFWKQFKFASKEIKDYKNLKSKLSNHNKELQQKLFQTNLTSFSTLNALEFLKWFFNLNGIDNFRIIDDFSVNPILKEKIKSIDRNAILLETKGVQFEIRNNPVYDVLARYLSFRNITTSNAMTFPYITTEMVFENGSMRTRTVTRFETLVAYHSETTPFVEQFNPIIYKTNFNSNLKFKTKGRKAKTCFRFENENFSKKYCIEEFNDSIGLNTFFTILAQENFTKWADINKGFFYFEKMKDAFYIYPNDGDENSVMRNHYFLNTISLNKSIQHLIQDGGTNFKNMEGAIKNSLENYIQKIASSVVLPLCSPVISREYYRPNKNYMILNNFEEFEKNENISNNFSVEEKNYARLVNKFCDPIFYEFTKSTRAKPYWFEKTNFTKLPNEWLKIDFKLKSYKVSHKVDMVTVIGVHVGPKIIPVNYDEFNAINENKVAFILPFDQKPKKDFTRIVINQALNMKTAYFEDNQSHSFFKENFIWTNDPSKISNSVDELDNLKIINDRFKKLLEIIKTPASFSLDETGVFILINGELTETKMQSVNTFLNLVTTLFDK